MLLRSSGTRSSTTQSRTFIRTIEMKSLPRSPWEAASRKRLRPSPAAQSPGQRNDASIIDLTGGDVGNSRESVAAAAEAKSQLTIPPQKQPPSLPPSPSSSPSIKSTPTREGREQPRSTYLRHFEDAMDFVMFSRHDYAILFDSEERAVVRRFSQLSRGAKSLYVRLFQRRGPWFRVDGMLGYDEVGSGTPLWVRNRDAAAARAALGAASPGDISMAGVVGERHECLLRMLPSSPFASPDDAGASSARTHLIVGSDASSEKSGDPAWTEIAIAIETVRDELDVPETSSAKGVSAAEKQSHPPTAVGAAPAALTPRELTTLHQDIQSSLHELINTGFLNALPNDVSGKGSGLDAVLASVECCLKSAEIKILLKRTGGLKASAGRALSLGSGPKEFDGVDGAPRPPVRRLGSISRGPVGRQAMIEELRQRLTGQQTLWGAKLPLVREIERLVIGSLEDLRVDIKSGARCGYDPSDEECGKGTSKRGHHYLVRAGDYPRVVFKRALRLTYFTTNTGALASGRVGAASVRGPQVAGAMSSWSPGLAVAFGKTRYAPYTCNPRTRIFETRDHFLRWEATVELRCALDGAIAELPRGWPEAATSSGVEGSEEGEKEGKESPHRSPPAASSAVMARGEGVRGVKHEVVLDSKQSGPEGAIRTAVDGLQDSVAQFFPGDPDGATIKAGQDFSTARCAALAISFLCSMCLHAHLGTSAILSASFSERLKSEATGIKDGEGEFLLLLDKACGRSGKSGCVQHSFTRDATGAVRETPTEKCDDGAGRNAEQQQKHLRPGLESNVNDKDLTQRMMADDRSSAKKYPNPAEGEERRNGRQVPEFLLQLDAGWVLASAVWEGVALLEKSRDYERAIELLAQLLATRYTPHRRGRWWMRLSLDLAHTGRNRCALWAVREGVRDNRVRGGDRLALEKRVTMLFDRSSKILDPKPAARSPKYQAPMAVAVPSHARLNMAPSSVGSGRPEQEAPLSIPLISPDNVFATRASPGALKRSGGSCAFNDEEEGEIFEDPSVERERRRQKRRRQKQRQKKRLQEEQPRFIRRSDEKSKRSSGPYLEKGKRQEKDMEGAALASTGSNSSIGGSDDATRGFHQLEIRGGTRSGDVGVDYILKALEIGGNDDGDGGSVVPAGVTDPPASKLEFEGLSEVKQVLGLLENEDDEGDATAAALEAFAATGAGIGRDTDSGVPEMSITGRRLNREVGMKSRFIGYDDSTACSVETLVLQHLSQQEKGSWAGWHCEGSPVRVLWALLMWNVIFADVPDVFQTPYQDAPLDLDHCPLFFLNRREAVDARLTEIRASPPPTLVALVADSWEANVNTVCRGVRWEASSVRYLQVLAAGLGGRALATAFAALCLNHKHFGGGLPDLLLMRAVRTGVRDPIGSSPPPGDVPAVTTGVEVSMPTRFASWLGVDLGASDANRGTPDDHRARAGSQSSAIGGNSTLPPPPPLEPADIEGFRVDAWLLEVKGPSDRLSDRQTAWLRILNHGGARVGVCHVIEGSEGSHVVRTTAAPRTKTEKHGA